MKKKKYEKRKKNLKKWIEAYIAIRQTNLRNGHTN